MWPLISGKNSTSPRIDIPASINALISGDYKIILGEMDLADWTGPVFPNSTNPRGGIPTVVDCGTKGSLFNIKQDPEERVDLADKMLDVLKEMQIKLAKYVSTYSNPQRGNEWPSAVEKYGNFWEPFLP